MKKSEYVEKELKKAISRGEWNVGDKILSEEKLAERYQVSRLSIRAAISSLAAQGILESHRGKGTFLCNTQPSVPQNHTNLTEKHFSRTDMYEFRKIIETQCAALAASRATEEDMQKMIQYAKALQNAKNLEETIEADFEFHRCIIEASRNEVIIETFNSLINPYQEMFSLNAKLRGSAGAEEHLKIILAIRTRNPHDASECMASHITESMIMENSYIID